MNDMPFLRLLEHRDSIEDITRLLHRAYEPLGERGLNYTAVDQTSETTRDRACRGRCCLAWVDDALVGTISVEGPRPDASCDWYGRTEVASAHQFAVDPAFQRKGIGSTLLQWAEDWARTIGFSEIAVDTAEPATELVSLYQRRGYRQVETVSWDGKAYRSVILSKRLEARG